MRIRRKFRTFFLEAFLCWLRTNQSNYILFFCFPEISHKVEFQSFSIVDESSTKKKGSETCVGKVCFLILRKKTSFLPLASGVFSHVFQVWAQKKTKKTSFWSKCWFGQHLYFSNTKKKLFFSFHFRLNYSFLLFWTHQERFSCRALFFFLHFQWSCSTSWTQKMLFLKRKALNKKVFSREKENLLVTKKTTSHTFFILRLSVFFCFFCLLLFCLSGEKLLLFFKGFTFV